MHVQKRPKTHTHANQGTKMHVRARECSIAHARACHCSKADMRLLMRGKYFKAETRKIVVKMSLARNSELAYQYAFIYDDSCLHQRTHSS